MTTTPNNDQLAETHARLIRPKLTVSDTEMTHTVFQNGVTTIIGLPERVGDVPVDKDLTRLRSAENRRFGDSAIGTFNEMRMVLDYSR